MLVMIPYRLVGRLGRGRSCVWLAACVSTGFNRTQFLGIGLKPVLEKHYLKKKRYLTTSVLVKLLLFFILSIALAGFNLGPESLSSGSFLVGFGAEWEMFLCPLPDLYP